MSLVLQDSTHTCDQILDIVGENFASKVFDVWSKVKADIGFDHFFLNNSNFDFEI